MFNGLFIYISHSCYIQGETDLEMYLYTRPFTKGELCHLFMKFVNISSTVSSNSEANASELLVKS